MNHEECHRLAGSFEHAGYMVILYTIDQVLHLASGFSAFGSIAWPRGFAVPPRANTAVS